MPFQPGNKLYQNRKINKAGGGRPTKDVAFSAEVERTAFVSAALSNGQEIGTHYRKRIFESDAVLVDARKWLTDKDDGQTQRPVAIQVVIEQGDKAVSPGNGANGNSSTHADIESAWSGGRVLIGGE